MYAKKNSPRSGAPVQSHCPQKEQIIESIRKNRQNFTWYRRLPPTTTMLAARPNSPKSVTMPSTTSYMPEKLLPPERNREANSTHRLSRLDVQRASTDIKRFVEARLEKDFNLVKASRHISSYFTGTFWCFIGTHITCILLIYSRQIRLFITHVLFLTHTAHDAARFY